MPKPSPVLRLLPIVGVLIFVVTLASCGSSGGSKSSKSAHPSACSFVSKLDDIANSVARADVHDPTTFKKTLDDAAHSYVANVRELRAVAPVELRSGLARVEADVQQYRFDAALTDRAALDAYAARPCGRVVTAATTTTTSVATGASVTTVDPASTVPTSLPGG